MRIDECNNLVVLVLARTLLSGGDFGFVVAPTSATSAPNTTPSPTTPASSAAATSSAFVSDGLRNFEHRVGGPQIPDGVAPD